MFYKAYQKKPRVVVNGNSLVGMQSNAAFMNPQTPYGVSMQTITLCVIGQVEINNGVFLK